MVARLGVKNAVQAALVACGAAASLPALSLGLGEIEMQSFLNEPLRAEVELLDTRQLNVDDIRIRLAGGDDFDRMGVERSFFLTSIQFEVDVDAATGRGVIRLRSEDAVLEPYLDLIIEARWPNGRLLREYTVLIDPPAFRQEMLTVSASESVAAQVPDSPAPAAAQPTRQTETSGDSIRRRESSLAPGQMPARAFSAETRESPRAGNRYMVRRDETLWQIARQGRPESVSVQQAMLDIQRLNPEAFIDGNINRIKAGYIIYLPEAGDISSDDLARALDEVREQNQQWQESRDIPGVTAAATLRVSADTSTTPGAGDAADSSARMGSRDSVEDTNAQSEPLESSASNTTVGLESAEDSMAAGDDSAAARVAEQLESMVQRLDTLEQIVALKDEQIATLEQALRESREAVAASSAVPTPARVTPEPTTAPVTRPTPRPAPTSSIPWLPLGGGVLVLALVGFFFMRRRAAQSEGAGSQLAAAASEKADDDVFAGVSLKREALAEPDVPAANAEKPEAEVSADVSEDVSDDHELKDDEVEVQAAGAGGSRGYGERKHDDYIDEAGGGDALAEADIYIAYGRYLQAIELLDSAIASDPGNSAYRVKLIELYVDMGEIESAAAQLEALREHGDTSAIERGEALLGGGGSPVKDDVLESPSVPEMEQSDSPLVLSEEPGLAEVSPAALAMTDEDDVAADDLELDLEAVGTDLADLDSLDIGAPEAMDSAASVISLDLDDVDEHESLGEVEFDDLEIEEDSVVSEEEDRGFAEHIGFAGAEGEEELDLSDALSGGVEDLDAPVDSTEPEDLLIAEDADQMATKLDLARAYIDMGDSAGAKTILEEVAASGSTAQQEEARDLISRMS